MFLIPLNQIESVELVVHALRIAGGEADCSTCPVRKVCMKQCLAIADAVSRMAVDGTLPTMGEEPEEMDSQQAAPPPPPAGSQETQRPALKVIK